MDKNVENLKYTEPIPYHFGLNHSNPSTLIHVFFAKIFVKKPSGPFAVFTYRHVLCEEKQKCRVEKNELNSCDKNLELIDGV